MEDTEPSTTTPRRTAAIQPSCPDLKHAFEWQQQQLKGIVQEELEKRLPPISSMSIISSLAKQITNIWPFLRSQREPRSNDNDKNTIDGLVSDNFDLQQEIKSLQDSLDKLRYDNLSLGEECSSLKTLQDDFRRKLAQERVKSAELERKADSLRSLLIPKVETQLSDGEIVAKFTSLRSQILKLVKTAWSRNIVHNAEVSEQQQKILRPFFVDRKVDMRYIDDRLRGVVFDILHEHIFSIRHYPVDAKYSCLGETLRNVEEYMLGNLHRVSYASILDWRMASLKATSAFGNNWDSLACSAYNAVDSFFSIFETPDAQATQGAKLLEKICKDAAALSMMMRTANDEYCIDMMSSVLGTPASEWLEFAEEEVSYPVVSETQQSDTIAYFMTGALVKLPYGNAKDAKVLEKAQAAVYRHFANKKG